MYTPTAGDLNVSRPLTNILVANMQSSADFVTDRIFPIVPSEMQGDQYYRLPNGAFLSSRMTQRADGTESEGIGFRYELDSFFCNVFALHHDVTDRQRANTRSPLSKDREAVTLLAHQALLHREKNWVDTYFKTGVWGTQLTGVAATPGAGQFLQWNDAASTPVEDIRAAKTAFRLRSGGLEPNTVVSSIEVIDKLLDHPDMIDRVKYGQTSGPAQIDMSDLASLFKIPNIYAIKAVENTAADGQTQANAYIAGKHFMLCHTPRTPGIMTPAAGYTFTWRGFPGGGELGGRTKKFRMENLEADRIEIQLAYTRKLVSADLGYMFLNAIA